MSKSPEEEKVRTESAARLKEATAFILVTADANGVIKWSGVGGGDTENAAITATLDAIHEARKADMLMSILAVEPRNPMG